MPEKYEVELDLDTKGADRKLSSFESKLRGATEKINNYSVGQHFQQGGALGGIGAAGQFAGAIGGKGANLLKMLPGMTGMIAQLINSSAPVLAPNISALAQKGAAQIGALDDTVEAFGSAKGSAKAVQGFFDARLKQRQRRIDAEAHNRAMIGTERLEAISTVGKGLPEAIVNDIKRNLEGIFAMLKQMLKLPF